MTLRALASPTSMRLSCPCFLLVVVMVMALSSPVLFALGGSASHDLGPCSLAFLMHALSAVVTCERVMVVIELSHSMSPLVNFAKLICMSTVFCEPLMKECRVFMLSACCNA